MARTAEEPRPVRGEPIPRGTERILFVDDEEAIAELGRKMLEGLGYRVSIATSGPEALELFRAEPGEFDLVVTDVTMPRMTGQSLIRRLRRLRPDLPAILTTGFTRALPPEEEEALGRPQFLPKPATKRELGEAVRRALVGRPPRGCRSRSGCPA
jgi:CheY-like chemotaxis protein